MKQTNHTPPALEIASDYQRRDLLESTKLSRLRERKSVNLPDIPFQKAAVVVCAGCGGRLDRDDNLQHSSSGGRKFIGTYARIAAAIEERGNRKKKI